jgi:hypothetical protein
MTTLYDEQELWALLRAFEERYGMDSAEFFRRWESGEFRDDPDLAEWAGLCARLGSPAD